MAKKANAGDKRLGNEFWKLRTKHGRDKLFESPEVLWDAACAYFQAATDTPLLTLEFNGKDAVECIVPKMRAFTWEGLENFLDIDSLREYKTNPAYKDFSQVITRIGKIIYTQKFEGAAAGLLNANIIARDLGLRDNTDVTTKGKELKAQPPIMFLSAESLTQEQIEKYLSGNAGADNEGL